VRDPRPQLHIGRLLDAHDALDDLLDLGAGLLVLDDRPHRDTQAGGGEQAEDAAREDQSARLGEYVG
jgi:hypothetical protein